MRKDGMKNVTITAHCGQAEQRENSSKLSIEYL